MKNMKKQIMKTITMGCAATGLILTANLVNASPYVVRGPFPATTAFGLLPAPTQVAGKEFSDHFDRDTGMPAVADPEQVISWDGGGGTTDSTFDYTGSRDAHLGFTDNDGEVHALAHATDLLFPAIIADAAHLLFSVDTSPDIYYENWGSSGKGLWAAAVTDIDDMNLISDLDGLEVWGPEGPGADDAIRYSLEGTSDPHGVAIWSYTGPGLHMSTPFASVAELAAAIAPLKGFTGIDIEAAFNLDGHMVGFETIMFTIDPITHPTSGGPLFDGGEIFVYTLGAGAGAATYLTHGGHFWDTAFDVRGTFGVASENVNALEAVSVIPEPGSILLLGTSLIGLAIGYNRRNRNA